ncbi:MAG TPA: VCBS repeat-containing protein, partial [Blastocatellia bacterium]|nr:VCBS repeat-containing protein [Blastocatellia bacterium]
MEKVNFRFTLLIAISAVIFTSACQNKPSTENAGTAPAVAATTATPTPEASASPSSSSSLPPLPAKFAEVTFTDVTSQAGIRFKHNNGAFGKKYLPETNGSGCAFLDYDNDGWQDILLINSTSFADAPKKINSVMALYHNNQNGTFTDVTRAAGLAKSIYGQGVAVGDYDNDGFVDIFVTALGQSRLFRNNGAGKFADVTAKVGLTSPGYFSSSAAFFDYDKDGRLDLFLCNYVEWSIETDVFCALDNVNKSYCTPEKYKGQSSRLYHNVGGKFVDVTEKAGLLDPT